MKGDAPISSIYRHATPNSEVDAAEEWGRMELMRRRAWQACGVIAVRPDQLPDHLSKEIEQWAEQNYGKRTR